MPRKYLFILGLLISIAGCKKQISSNSTDNLIREYLKANLPEKDFGNVDWSLTSSSRLTDSSSITKIGFVGKNLLHDFILIHSNPSGIINKAKIVHIDGTITQKDAKTYPSFNGLIEISSLKRDIETSSVILNGFVKSLHKSTVSVNSLHVNYDCSDCTLPEVVVSSSYNGGGISWGAWMNIMAMFDVGNSNEYLLTEYSGGGGGGGGSTPPPVITIDPEAPENKQKIEPKKYTDCFGSVPDGSTTLYTLTISADLPTDGHPEIFYNWSDGSPGHAFIELSKSTPYGGVTQDFGFYPTSSYKLVTLDNVNLTSKLVDDGGHEYQARYTISVSAAQFQAAVNAVNNARNTYNVGLYNCTDFALDVFNAAGAGFNIPRHSIPGFEVDGGSNTPQGLYEKIQSMKNNGSAGTTTTNNKEYAGSSKGPCE